MNNIANDEEFLKLSKKFPILSLIKKHIDIDKTPYVIIDIETTGLNPASSEIIEIGAIKSDGRDAKDIFQSLICPKGPVPAEIETLTGITQEMVNGQPDIKEVLQRFLDFIGENVLVAHNSDFDIGFLKHHISKELNKPLDNKTICTVKVSRSILPGLKNYKLHTVAEHLGVPIPVRHRAMGDCEITYNIWNKLLDVLTAKGMSSINDIENIMRESDARFKSYRPR